MIFERHVKLSKNGRNQRSRIPVSSSFPAGSIMRKEGERLIIEPRSGEILLALLATLSRSKTNFHQS